MPKITKRLTTTLKLLKNRPISAVELTDEEISAIQELVNQGLAYDYAAFSGRRTEVRLRIWGITDAGKAIILQQDLIGMTSNRRDRQLGLVLQRAREDPEARLKSRFQRKGPEDGIVPFPSTKRKESG